MYFSMKTIICFYPRNIVRMVKLKREISSIKAVRHYKLGHPLCGVMASLGQNPRYFDNLSKIHLEPLALVVALSNISGLVVEPSFICCIGCAILQI